jgi:preprotein translocase subunit SecD
VTVTFPDSCSVAMQNTDYEIIKKRIAAIYKIREITPLKNGKFTVTCFKGKDTVSIAKLLAPRGNLYIGEFSDNTKKIIQAIFYDENSGNLSELAAKLSYQEYPVIGMCLTKDTAFVDSILLKTKYLTDKVKFMWSDKPVNSQAHLLLAINDKTTITELNSKTIESAKIEKSRYDVLFVDMNFKKEFHEKWAKVTHENIGNCLPVILDGKLIGFPRVQSEITHGTMTISGIFDYNELLLLKSIILSGQLNCEFSVVE